MNLLQSIVKYLESYGLGIAGRDLFYGFMPHEKTGLLVTSQMPMLIDPYTRLRKGSFQVIARGRDQDELGGQLREVSKVLRSEGLLLGDLRFSYILPRHEPLLFPRSESSMVEGSVNFDCCFAIL